MNNVRIIEELPSFYYDTAQHYDKERKRVYYILCPKTFKPLTKEIKARSPILAAKSYIKDIKNKYSELNYNISEEWVNKSICVYDIETSKLSLYYNNGTTIIPSGNFMIDKHKKKKAVLSEIYPNIKSCIEDIENELNYKSDFSDNSDESEGSFFNSNWDDVNSDNEQYNYDEITYTNNRNYDDYNLIDRYNHRNINHNNDELESINIAIEKLNINERGNDVYKPWLMYGGRRKRSEGFDR